MLAVKGEDISVLHVAPLVYWTSYMVRSLLACTVLQSLSAGISSHWAAASLSNFFLKAYLEKSRYGKIGLSILDVAF